MIHNRKRNEERVRSMAPTRVVIPPDARDDGQTLAGTLHPVAAGATLLVHNPRRMQSQLAWNRNRRVRATGRPKDEIPEVIPYGLLAAARAAWTDERADRHPPFAPEYEHGYFGPASGGDRAVAAWDWEAVA